MAGFLLRWFAALFLVMATFNPTKWNYVEWTLAGWRDNLPMVVLCGLVLAIGFIIYLRATLRSIGAFGIILVLALIAAILWVLVDRGWLSLEDKTFMTWIGLIALSLVLAIGLSWSRVRRVPSGQVDMDDVDD